MSNGLLKFSWYIYNRFPSLKDIIKFDDLYWMVLNNAEKIVSVTDDDSNYLGGSMFFTLNDEHYEMIKSGEVNFLNPDIFNFLLKDNGDNLHFVFVAAEDLKTILKGLKFTINRINPKTVSWYDQNFNFRQLRFRKENLCLL